MNIHTPPSSTTLNIRDAYERKAISRVHLGKMEWIIDDAVETLLLVSLRFSERA